ncbi:ATPase-like, ParA/MinD [Thalassoporum mexicanum PCC 7367]|uniref:Mrp/NBP35 family ATP-binding protein n=1 Tax=Thalassoporum mexicanum TaxID=3457544 RepID=UPI00029FD1A4|nr:Mrp/NBP35 family ATP-binding protein [Pseudanabaena sp. PCC 7367]AFY68502.1 ATPase-like, ParA/MinD [Pseudanabaena sp. PCC 7367]
MTDLPSQDQILTALRPIADPVSRKGLIAAGAVKEVNIKPSGVVGLTLALAINDATARQATIDRCKEAVKAIPGVSDVWIKLANPPEQAAPSSQPQSAQANQSSQPGQPGQPRIDGLVPVSGVKHIIAVSSGKGGVGKTSVAVNLSVSLAETGAKVGLLDADIYGPNVPTMLGMADAQIMVIKGEDGSDIVEPAFNHGVKMISMAFLIDRDQPVVWRGPMLNGVIRQFLYQANWGDLDYLIVDMPPGTGDAQLTLTQSVPLEGAIVVTTPQTVSLLDSRKSLKMFQNMGIPVLGIVENMSYFVPPDLPDRQYDIFGSGGGEKTATELQVPLLGRVPLEIDLRVGGDRGVPIVLAAPESASAQALKGIAETIATKIAVPAS